MKPDIAMIGAPMDLGGGRRGTDMGPNGVRLAGIEAAITELGFGFQDTGNIQVADFSDQDAGNTNAKYLNEIVTSCAELSVRTEAALVSGQFPYVVGGDHSIAVGTVAGVSSHFDRQNKKIGLLWYDAHGDMNTPETSPSGNVHGMPLASCLGLGPDELSRLGSRFPLVDASKVAVVGVRSIDDKEKQLVKEMGLRVFTMREIDMVGMHQVMTEALEIVTSDTAGFHISFDVDGADPSIAPGVGTPVKGGLNLRESHLFMEMAAETEKVLSLEITEINPILDMANQTSKLAVSLTQSALGKLIL